MRGSKSLKRLAIAALLAAVLGAGAAHAETTIYRNFTLFDGVGASAAANSAMVVVDGKIAAIGPAAQIRAPSGAQVVDLGGKFVIPGLIDSHTHLANTRGLEQRTENYTRESLEHDLRLYSSYGVTTVQSLGTDKDIVFDVRAEQRKSGRPDMARVFTSGQGIWLNGGYGGLVGVPGAVTTVAQARAAVDAQAAKGADQIKFRVDDEFGSLKSKMPPEMSAAIIDEAHKKNMRVVAHVFYLADAKRLVEQGVNGFVHMVRDRPVDQAYIDAMKAKGVWQMAATLSREFSFSHVLAPYVNDPFFTRGVTPETIAALTNPTRVNGLADAALYPTYKKVLTQAEQNFIALAKAGVNYGVGTDSGPPGRFAGIFLHIELEELVKAGLTPAQALIAATSGNARFLGARDIGALQKSRWADFVVLEADPLVDIKNTRKISAVYIAGRSAPTIWARCEGREPSACNGAVR